MGPSTLGPHHSYGTNNPYGCRVSESTIRSFILNEVRNYYDNPAVIYNVTQVGIAPKSSSSRKARPNLVLLPHFRVNY